MPRLPAHITTTQLDAVRLILSGYTSAQAATKLNTTEQAIHLRIRAVMNTLHVKTRPQLAVAVIHLGLLTVDEIELPAYTRYELVKRVV